MVIVEVADWPVLAEAGLVDTIAMSGVWTVKVKLASTWREPLTPVIVTVEVPSWVEWQPIVAVAGEEVSATVAGLTEHVRV